MKAFVQVPLEKHKRRTKGKPSHCSALNLWSVMRLELQNICHLLFGLWKAHLYKNEKRAAWWTLRLAKKKKKRERVMTKEEKAKGFYQATYRFLLVLQGHRNISATSILRFGTHDILYISHVMMCICENHVKEHFDLNF